MYIVLLLHIMSTTLLHVHVYNYVHVHVYVTCMYTFFLFKGTAWGSSSSKSRDSYRTRQVEGGKVEAGRPCVKTWGTYILYIIVLVCMRSLTDTNVWSNTFLCCVIIYPSTFSENVLYTCSTCTYGEVCLWNSEYIEWVEDGGTWSLLQYYWTEAGRNERWSQVCSTMASFPASPSWK